VTRYLSNYDRLVDMIHDVVERDAVREWQPPITGEEIMNLCGIQPGKMVGILKTLVEDAVLAGTIPNEKQSAIEYLLSIRDDVIAMGDGKKPVSSKLSLKSLPKSVRK
jgi:poly(A) polymerase